MKAVFKAVVPFAAAFAMPAQAATMINSPHSIAAQLLFTIKGFVAGSGAGIPGLAQPLDATNVFGTGGNLERQAYSAVFLYDKSWIVENGDYTYLTRDGSRGLGLGLDAPLISGTLTINGHSIPISAQDETIAATSSSGAIFASRGLTFHGIRFDISTNKIRSGFPDFELQAPEVAGSGYIYSIAYTGPNIEYEPMLALGFNVSSISASTIGAVAAVPEPATWAMLLFGFGGVGAALRRRNPRRVNVSYA